MTSRAFQFGHALGLFESTGPMSEKFEELGLERMKRESRYLFCDRPQVSK